MLLKLLGLHPVVVHGGGPQISRMLDKAGVKSTFVDGLRVTDEATMEVAEMVLSGAINKEIANWITLAGARGRRARRGPVGQGRPADHRREGDPTTQATRTARSSRPSTWASWASRPRSIRS